MNRGEDRETIQRKKRRQSYPVGLICGWLVLIWLLAGCAAREQSPEAVAPEESQTADVAQMSEAASSEAASSEAASEAVQSSEPAEEVAVSTPEPEEPPTITIRMVGDILQHDRVFGYALQEDGSYDFSVIFEGLKEEISEADLAIVNQEVIIAGEEFGISGYPTFNAPFALGDALVDAGFDVICHGTNHALDKGKKGLLRCLEYWESEYPEVAVLGIHDSQADRNRIYVYEQDGIRVAVLNYTYGTNGIPLPADMPYAVDLLEREQVIADIHMAEALADFTVVCPHWGSEYVLEETAEQRQWAELFLDHGVDLVLGTHPHVIEPIEMMVDEETGHEMLVYYSLGNFVNWTSSAKAGVANRMVGGMADVTIGRSEDGEVVITDYSVTAVVTHLESRVNGVYTTRLAEYTQELSLQNEITRQDPAFSRDYCVDLCNRIWGDGWE